MADRNFKVKHGITIGDNIAIDDDATITGLDTDNLDEGTTNLYYTEARVDANFNTKTTDALDEGTTNLYYTEARVDANFATKTTDQLTEGTTNRYYSSALFDADLATKDTDDLAEGTNLYFTTARAREAYTGTGNITVNATTGVISFEGPTGPDTTDELTEGTTNLYYTDARARSAVANGTDIVDGGAGDVYVGSLRNDTRVLGQLEFTQDPTYTFPDPVSNLVDGSNGITIASSDGTGKGYTAGIGLFHYQGDTTAGNQVAPAIALQTASGPNTAPTAIASGTVFGTMNFGGYSGSNFASNVATDNSGGGRTALHPLQWQAYTTQAFAESTINLTSTSTIQSNVTVAGVVSSGNGVFTNTSADVRQYDVIRVTGTLTGTMTFPGYVSGNLYYVTAGANPTTTFTISDTHDGAPIATTAGTTTGLTFTRCRSIINFAAQTSAPFATSSLITAAGFTPSGYNGTFRCTFGTTTSVGYGNYHAGGAATVQGTVSVATVTAAGSGYRIRAFPNSYTMNSANRINLLDHSATSATYRSDSHTWQGATNTFNYMVLNAAGGTFSVGSLAVKDLAGTSTYGTINSSGLTLGPQGSGNISYNRTYGCFHKMANITAAAANTVYSFDWYTSATAHVGNQGVTVTSGNPTRIAIDTAGQYEAVIEMMVKNTDNAERKTWIWLAKNGTDLAETRIKVGIRPASAGVDTYQLITKLWMLDNIVANDYIEVRFAVDNTSGISLEYEAAQTTPFAMPAQPSATITIVPVGA